MPRLRQKADYNGQAGLVSGREEGFSAEKSENGELAGPRTSLILCFFSFLRSYGGLSLAVIGVVGSGLRWMAGLGMPEMLFRRLNG